MTRLENRVAIVTGAAQGIGLACAKRFLAEGAKVMLVDVNDWKGKKMAEELGRFEHSARFFKADVSHRREVDAMIDATVDAFGRVDIMLSNAGIVHAAEFLDLAEADWDRVMGVNLKGVFLCGQAAARQMVKQGGGRGVILNMSSVNAVVAIPNQVPYVVAKGGVNQLTKVMALALAPHKIRVCALGPGTILTELARNAVMSDEGARKKLLSRTPMGRLGEPEEVAAVAAFLASDDASYITGTTIYADGGRLALNYTVPVES
jgi:NAD(P)-dependent dehydrogenase (short-subunit alcohol dehydrogenase family)